MRSGIALTLAAGTRLKKTISAVGICLLSIACAFTLPEYLTPQNANSTATPVVIYTATRTPTASPTFPTPTFTSTPTKIGEKTKTPTSTITARPTQGPSSTPMPPVTRDTATPTTFMDGLVFVQISNDRFYLKGCPPNSVRIKVQVADAGRVGYLVLFVRLRSRETGVQSEWTNFTMANQGGGTYIHELLPEEIIGVDVFADPVVEYQVVTTDVRSEVLGRSGVFKNRLSLITSGACTPTATSTSG